MKKIIISIYNFIKKYIWIFTTCLAISAFFIREETRNFVWNQGFLFPFIFSFLINITLAIYIIYSKSKINKTDIETYNAAMSLLNYDNVNYYLEEYDMGGLLKWDEMKRFYNFRLYCSMAKFHIKHRKLRKLILSFKISLDNFLNKLALYTSPLDHNPDFIRIPKELEREDRKEWEKRSQELNNLATLAFNEFKKLVKFAKEKEIDKTY
jgi:hypothetical protein